MRLQATRRRRSLHHWHLITVLILTKVLIFVVCWLCMTMMSPALNDAAVLFEQVPAVLAPPVAVTVQVAEVAVGVADPTAALNRVTTLVTVPPAGAGLLYTLPTAVKPPIGTVHAGMGNQKLALRV